MNMEEVRNSLNELIDKTLELANSNPVPDSKSQYLRVLEGVFRKNFIRLQAIELLTRDRLTAPVAMEVARNMVEDVIGVEYMRLKGEETYAKKFFDFWEVHYYKLTHLPLGKGYGISQSEINEAKERYDRLPSALRRRKNWAGCDVETQLEIVLAAKAMQDRDAKLLETTYNLGSLKSHFNPYDIMTYLHDDYFEHSIDFALKIALFFSLASQVRITTRYVDKINQEHGNMDYASYAHEANNILGKYN